MKKSIDQKEIYSRRIRSIKWRFSFFVLFLICTDETYNRLKLQKKKKNLHNIHSIRKQRVNEIFGNTTSKKRTKDDSRLLLKMIYIYFFLQNCTH